MSPRLLTFGGLSVADGTPINGAANPRSRLAILAVLAAAGDRGVRREKLATLFWPDSDEDRGRNALRQALFQLRRDVGDGDIILGVSDLRLNPNVLSADVTEFDAAIQSGRYKDAVSFYRGPFLDGVFVRDAPEFEHWVDDQRQRLSAAFGRALESLAAAAATHGDTTAAVSWWERLAVHDPLSARVALHYMEALVAAGDREHAVRYGLAHADRVRQELDAEADREVVSYVECLRVDAGSALAPDDIEIGGSAHRTKRPDARPESPTGSPGPAWIAASLVPRASGVRTFLDRYRTLVVVAVPALAAIAIAVIRMRPAPPSRPMIAVARLENRTGDSALTTLGDLATDDITRQLTQSGSIAIVDLRNGDPKRSSAEAARSLGAQQLVDGRMYRKGESLHVQMQVVDPRDGRVMHQFDPVVVPAVNAYTVLDLLRDRVGGAVAALTDTVYQPWSRAHSRPPNYAAFREFMLGLHAIVHVGMDSAVVHLTRAVQLDTSFVEAKIWLLEQISPTSTGGDLAFADSIAAAAERQRNVLSEFDRLSLDRAMAFRTGRWEDVYRAARQLVAIAPETQDAQVFLVHSAMATRRFSEAIATVHRLDRSRGWLKDLRMMSDFDLQAHRLRGEFDIAVEEWRRSWEISPKTWTGCVSGMQQLAAAGREREVDSLFADCARLQDAPAMKASVHELIGRWYRAGGYLDPARRSFDRSLVRRTEAARTDPRHRRLVGLVQCELEDWQAAHASLMAAADTTDADDRVALAIASAHVGDTTTVRETLEWLDRWPQRAKPFGRDKMSRAFLFVALERRDEAFVLLRQAIADGMAPPFQRWRNRFELTSLRGDPAFEALVRERK